MFESFKPPVSTPPDLVSAADDVALLQPCPCVDFDDVIPCHCCEPSASYATSLTQPGYLYHQFTALCCYCVRRLLFSNCEIERCSLLNSATTVFWNELLPDVLIDATSLCGLEGRHGIVGSTLKTSVYIMHKPRATVMTRIATAVL